MKLRILRPYLDYEVGKTYTAESVEQGRYMIAMSIAKEVVSKGKEPEVDPQVAKIAEVTAQAQAEKDKAESEWSEEYQGAGKDEIIPEAKKEVKPVAKKEVKPVAKKEIKADAKVETTKSLEDEDLELF